MGEVLPGPGSSWTSLEETGGYDPEQFYCTATDKKGHCQEFRVKAPPQVAGQLSAMLATRKFPYRTQNDFFRDAMIHRLHQLARMNEGEVRDLLDNLVAGLVVEDRINRARVELGRLAGMVTAIEALGDEAYAAQDGPMLEEALSEAKTLGETVREPYAQQLRQLADLFENRLAKLI